MNKLITVLICSFMFCSFFVVSAYAEISWVDSMDEGLTIAKNQGKPIMIDFYTDWCFWCKKLDSETYSDSKVQELADSFVCIKIDGDKDRANTAKYKVNGYPTIVFLNKNGKEIYRSPGYVDAPTLIRAMEKALK